MNPDRTSTIPTRNTNYFNYLIYEWFVRYNPLYFVSAACFIFGVLLLSEGMRNINWIDGQIMLTGVIEFYQLMLLAHLTFSTSPPSMHL